MSGDPPPPPPPSIESATPQQSFSLQAASESLSRITLATIGGALAGLSFQRQQEALQNHPSIRVHPGQFRHPTVIPRAWALSCAMFALVLESCRWSSPSTHLIRATVGDSLINPTQFTTTVMDYSLGGTVAGLAGAMGHRRRPFVPGRPLSLGWGMMMGLSLGAIGGLFQATIDAANSYVQQQEQQQEDERQTQQRQHDDEQMLSDIEEEE
jgi:hypothetical protein